VVSERLEHSTPGFTMATYQLVIPGMQEEAARTFAGILDGSADLQTEDVVQMWCSGGAVGIVPEIALRNRRSRQWR
jgi:hypothetical protein